jgi:hypothetical protein
MYKLIKTKITGFDDRDDSPIGLNANYRTTMGYNAATETISVKHEEDKQVEQDVRLTSVKQEEGKEGPPSNEQDEHAHQGRPLSGINECKGSD